jgi:hypothetical protein
MARFNGVVLAAVLLSACSGNPFAPPGDDGGTPTTPTALIPANVTKDMVSANLAEWTTGNPTLRLRMTAQDATALNADYLRDASLDVGPYQAYTYQSSTSNRKVVALVNGTANLKATIAVEAGQFADYHTGAQAWRADVYTLPASGVGATFDYSGTYAGLLNIGDMTAGGPGGSLNPTQSYRTTGRTLITADFTEMTVSGGVDQRKIVETDEALVDIALGKTGITATGTFAGDVYRGESEDWIKAGDYAGAFGGLNASEVAVLLIFNPTSNSKLFEQGIILLPSCTSGGGPACP